jgi:hypothetical protein
MKSNQHNLVLLPNHPLHFLFCKKKYENFLLVFLFIYVYYSYFYVCLCCFMYIFFFAPDEGSFFMLFSFLMGIVIIYCLYVSTQLATFFTSLFWLGILFCMFQLFFLDFFFILQVTMETNEKKNLCKHQQLIKCDISALIIIFFT